MNVDGLIYAAVFIAICSSLVAVSIGSWVLWRIYRSRMQPRPVAGMLLLVVLAMALAQALEQTRVLVFRLSYDGIIEQPTFPLLYAATWNVVSSKLLMSMAVASGSMLQLALYCRRSAWEVRLFVIVGWLGTFMAWVGLAILLEFWI